MMVQVRVILQSMKIQVHHLWHWDRGDNTTASPVCETDKGISKIVVMLNKIWVASFVIKYTVWNLWNQLVSFYGKSMMSTMLLVLVGNMHYYVINSITFCIVLFVTMEAIVHHVSAFASLLCKPNWNKLKTCITISLQHINQIKSNQFYHTLTHSLNISWNT